MGEGVESEMKSAVTIFLSVLAGGFLAFALFLVIQWVKEWRVK